MFTKAMRGKTNEWGIFISEPICTSGDCTQLNWVLTKRMCIWYDVKRQRYYTILRQLLTNEEVVSEVKATYQHVLDLRSKIQETCELVKNELANSQQKSKI